MGLLGGIDPYKPVQVDPNASQGYQQAFDTAQNAALKPASSYQQDINQNVKEQSNLMGPSDSDTPFNSALDSRARQSYESSVNRMANNSVIPAAQRQDSQYGTAMQNQAAMFQNFQTRSQLNWQQISYQRSAAIQNAAMNQQLLGQLCGGAGSIAGGALAQAQWNAKNPLPTEAPALSVPSSGIGGNYSLNNPTGGGGSSWNLGGAQPGESYIAKNDPFDPMNNMR